MDFIEGCVVICERSISAAKWFLEREVRSILSCTEFHNWVEFSFDMDIIPFAVPLRIKSA